MARDETSAPTVRSAKPNQHTISKRRVEFVLFHLALAPQLSRVRTARSLSFSRRSADQRATVTPTGTMHTPASFAAAGTRGA